MTLKVICPAKVNLFLSVGDKDETGYHPIRTIFQTVSLADELEIGTSSKDSFECDAAFVPEENTVTKAWRLSREYVDLPRLAIKLQKRIPAQSGLAGGSSDAAGLLAALVKLTGGALSYENALEVAAAVGSDVPFFLKGGKARATGYGEKLESLEDPATQWLVIAMPEKGVSTIEAYRRLDAHPRELRDFPSHCRDSTNDFELVAPQDSLHLILQLKNSGAEFARLSGSGSAVFGFFDCRATAERVAAEMQSSTVRTWSCRTVSSKEIPWMS